MTNTDTQDSRFIGEPVTVEFDEQPKWSKSPHCPSRVIWRGETHEITAVLREWRDYERRGRMASNMRPENARRARQRGSWGVGRFYFHIRFTDGREFELYYDRAPKGSDQRLGSWHLYREILVSP
jgi:hypothetical protein